MVGVDSYISSYPAKVAANDGIYEKIYLLLYLYPFGSALVLTTHKDLIGSLWFDFGCSGFAKNGGQKSITDP